MPAPKLPPLPENLIEAFNSQTGGFNKTMGLQFVSISYDRIEARVEVGPHLLQPYGLVHGGVYSSIVETIASAGAALNVMPLGKTAVGLENTTSFLRAVRQGHLHGVGVPLARGRRSHVWQVTITDDDQRVVASGRVRMICMDTGAQVAGETVAMKVSS